MKLPSFLAIDTDGFIHVKGHRIGLQHLVHYYKEGFSPEMLAAEYPSLSLAEIHKVIAFYLEHRDKVDNYCAKCESQIATERTSTKTGPTVDELRSRLQATQGAEND